MVKTKEKKLGKSPWEDKDVWRFADLHRLSTKRNPDKNLSRI